MPELKRPRDSSNSNALVLAKKPRNELVQVSDKAKALVQSVSFNLACRNPNWIGVFLRLFL